MLKHLEDVFDAGRDEVGGRGEGHFDGSGGEPGDGVGETFFLGGPDPGAVASVRVEGRSNVPAINAVSGPGAPIGRFLMD